MSQLNKPNYQLFRVYLAIFPPQTLHELVILAKKCNVQLSGQVANN